MMQLQYDPGLVEQATFLATRSDSAQARAMHALLDPLYRIADGELRQRAFQEGHAVLFRRFGLDQIIPAYLREFPLLSAKVGRGIVREAERRRAQSADLYRPNSAGGTGAVEPVLIIALCPEFLVDQELLRPWMYRQLQHVADMVDERFAYQRELPAGSAVQQNLIRDRYALLWDMFVEGRLIRAGAITGDGVYRLRVAFEKAFVREGQGRARIAFDALLSRDDLTHSALMSWATQPELICAERAGIGGEHERDATCALA
jgi:hypothetical protein